MPTISVKRAVAVLLAAVLVVAVINLVGGQPAAESKSNKARNARATLINAEGDDVGKVRMTERRGGAVLVVARISDAEPGFHGFHVHETGECDPDAPDGPFTSAGGHFAMEGQVHGEHAGDLPSLLVMDDGSATLAFETDSFRIRDLFDSDGSAVMVHAGRDNFANIPERYVSTASGQPGPDEATLATGDAGARSACGVLVKRGRG